MEFKICSKIKPKGDQPKAIKKLVEGVRRGDRYQTLLGVTGSGKTFTIANVIERVNKPTLVISHNKTLAAQLYGEFRSLFPFNRVEYFISYYDYYQPEAYLPVTDTYIEKDASRNEEIERMRLKTISSLIERKDVIVVASVSCIYGIGKPDEFKSGIIKIRKNDPYPREDLIKDLVNSYYTRNDLELKRGSFRVHGGVLDIFPMEEEYALRVEIWGEVVEKIYKIHPITMKKLTPLDCCHIYPANEFVVREPTLKEAIEGIKKELKERISYFKAKGKLLEAERLRRRTLYDIELMEEVGYCPGIENYSRWLTGRKKGERPSCLLDYFPEDYLVVIDESHVTLPQLIGMYEGDRSRKEVLVEYGFRLPSALDNRPLKFHEFLNLVPQVIFTSATPGEFEYQHSTQVVEQIIRPTGLVDPRVTIKPTKGEVDDLIEEIKKRKKKGEKVLVTTLTKRMAEDLAGFLVEEGLKVRWLHSELPAIERVELLRGLRLGDYDCIVGINLLREGLDLPEVSLVAILDADKEGFLRSYTSLIQMIGRTARNVRGEVIMYADNITSSIRKAVEETNRRRELQMKYNEKYGITPTTVYKTKEEILQSTVVAGEKEEEKVEEEEGLTYLEKLELLKRLEKKMLQLADDLLFEDAAKVRDKIQKLKNELRQRNNKISTKRRYR